MSHLAAPQTLSHRTDNPSTVFIASEELLARWCEQASPPTDLLAFSDSDAAHALDVIYRSQPDVVILEQMFAFTERGTALVAEMMSDPRLERTDFRLLPSDRSATLGTNGPRNGLALASLARPFAHRPLRQAGRVRMPSGTQVVVDGLPATLVDFSTAGAQIISTKILKPSQNVRLVVEHNSTTHRVVANIVWSSLEMVDASVLCRAGVEFKNARPEFLNALSATAKD